MPGTYVAKKDHQEESMKIKEGVKVINKNGINYLYKNNEKLLYKSWIGDLFSFLYDSIMVKSIFPKKFQASVHKHRQFLERELSNVHNKYIVELAAGSGNLAEILPPDNFYTGIDISEGLLGIAYKKFIKHQFVNPELFLCCAEELPFQDSIFDMCLCNLSLNFFEDAGGVLKEVHRVLKKRGIFICSVPVPERNKKQSRIRGTLHSEEEIKKIIKDTGFHYSSYDVKNGALLYFKGEKR
jgi:SAM-dependent methyltransferase